MRLFGCPSFSNLKSGKIIKRAALRKWRCNRKRKKKKKKRKSSFTKSEKKKQKPKFQLNSIIYLITKRKALCLVSLNEVKYF